MGKIFSIIFSILLIITFLLITLCVLYFKIQKIGLIETTLSETNLLKYISFTNSIWIFYVSIILLSTYIFPHANNLFQFIVKFTMSSKNTKNPVLLICSIIGFFLGIISLFRFTFIL